MSKDRAFESLLTQNYSSFILTALKCIAVSIYHTYNESYKIFASRARDEYVGIHT